MKENSILENIHNALLPYPGRMNQTVRTVISCVFVVIISLSLQIPYIPLSIIVVFFLTQTNIVITKIIGFLFIIAGTLAILVSLLIIIITWNSPFLRILLSSLVFLISFFLMRTTKVGILFYIISIVVIYSQSLVDIAPNAELLVRSILWVWVSVIYTIVVTLIVNTLLLPIEPEKQLTNFLIYQIKIINKCINPTISSTEKDHNIVQVGMDLQAMYKYLRFSIMRDKNNTLDKQYYIEKITLISEIRNLSAKLPQELANEEDKIFATQLANTLENIMLSLEKKSLSEQDIIDYKTTNNVILNRIYSALKRYLDSEKNYLSKEEVESILNKVDQPKERFWIEDAFTNSRYIIFALKTLLSVLVSYFIYTLTDWTGISTFMLSCLIIAQPGLGNVQRKVILRLSGAVIGAAFALFSIMFITNQINSIFGLLLLIIPVFFLAGWVATGQENISYAGIQIAFTFSLALLETTGPVYELTAVRDRIIGIILGIILGSIIHIFISPEREGSIILGKLASIIELVRNEWSPKNKQEMKLTREDIAIKLFECNEFISRVSIEPTWVNNEGSHDSFNQYTQEIFYLLKNIIYNYEKLLLQFDDSKKTMDHKTIESNTEIINQYKNNLFLITLRLQGARTNRPHYPDLNKVKNNNLKELMQNFELSMNSFFNLGR
ncbi:FUSC family protein [Proteus faecis]|uniref:FUSC family protein n=1 Tax=Proteus faecis TaxID=2050967 RepID=UPI000D69EE86|nr:FUSC family protein [Proteus faecis]